MSSFQALSLAHTLQYHQHHLLGHNEMLVNPYLNEDAAGWVIEEGGRIKNIRNSNMVVVHKSKGFILGCAKIVAVSRAGIANEEDSLWDFEFLPRQSISLTSVSWVVIVIFGLLWIKFSIHFIVLLI